MERERRATYYYLVVQKGTGKVVYQFAITSDTQEKAKKAAFARRRGWFKASGTKQGYSEKNTYLLCDYRRLEAGREEQRFQCWKCKSWYWGQYCPRCQAGEYEYYQRYLDALEGSLAQKDPLVALGLEKKLNY